MEPDSENIESPGFLSSESNPREFWRRSTGVAVTVGLMFALLVTTPPLAREVESSINEKVVLQGADPLLKDQAIILEKEENYRLDVRLKGFRRADLHLQDYAGKVVVLHFWATWCPPCLKEIPAIDRFMEEQYPALEKRGSVLLTVSNDIRKKDLDRFLALHKLNTPVYLDERGELNDRLKLIGLPTTVILGTRGEVLAKLHGTQDWDSEGFVRYLERFLE